MINKNKILKAINEGIKSGFKFSSNDARDNSSIIDFSDSKINNIESFNMRKIEEQYFVDLGLSVKWAKCNIGATCQDTPESWYGNYYAWGELKTKYNYSKDSYNQSLYEKYNKDTLHILQSEDDVVTQTYYGIDKFRMPSEEEIEELLDKNKIKNEQKTNYQGIEGLNGREFTSKITGNSIFIPAAGYFYDSELNDDNSYYYYYLWSNSLNLDNPNYAWHLRFYSGRVCIGNCDRYFGFSVRGVCS